MKRYRELGDTPISSPLPSEVIFELHAARLILLIKHCGISERIDGLTKLAKLDFFVRYPDFFLKATSVLGGQVEAVSKSSESSMVRYRYGPWDNRYYHLLSYLESTGLISIERSGSLYRLSLTPSGTHLASRIGEDSSYDSLIQHMKGVKKTMGSKSGTSLKKLIYNVFESEVGDRSLGEVIE